MISELLEAYIRMHNINQKELAKSLGLSPTTLSRLKLGRISLDNNQMLKLINWLFTPVKK